MASFPIRFVGAILSLVPLFPQVATGQALRSNSIALMNFTNATLVNSEAYAPLEWSIPELIATRLSRNPRLEIVDRRRIQELLDEQNLGASGRVDPATAARVGRILGARYMLFGTVLLDRRNRLRVDARVLDVETSKIVHSETIRDADWNEDISYVVDSLAERLSRNLKLPGGILSVPADAAPTNRALSEPAASNRVPSAVASTNVRSSPAGSTAFSDSTQLVARSRSAGFVTIGRALRLDRTRGGDKSMVVSMLRAAATETPSLARDVEEILRRRPSGM